MRIRIAIVTAVCLSLGGTLAGPAAVAAAVSITLSRAAGPPTSSVRVHGTGFGARETVTITFGRESVGTDETDGSGAFSKAIRVPKKALPGAHVLRATGAATSRSATAPFTVRTDWRRFRFDGRHSGVQPFENVLDASTVPNLQLAWQARLGKLVDSSSPAIVHGVAYIGSSDGRLWAWPADGCGTDLCTEPLWTSTDLAQIIDSPTVAGGMVFVGSQTSATSNDGRLDVFDAGGCGLPVCPPLWQGRAGHESILQSSPAVVGGRVYIGSYDGKLYVFDAGGCGTALCDPLWTGATGGPIESSPTVSGDTVFIGSNDGRLYAFPAGGCGAATCTPRWKGAAGETIFDSSPAVVGGTVYIGSVHHLVAFAAAGCHAATCQPLWRGSNGSDFVGGSPAVFGGRVYIGLESAVGVFDAAGCGQAHCPPSWLDFGSGFQAQVLSSPTIANGVVYVGRNTGEVLAWRTGPCGHLQCHQIWSYLTNDAIVDSSPSVVDGKLYIGGANNMDEESHAGRLYVFGLP
jgi:outer membrane protein assembly factor BamB